MEAQFGKIIGLSVGIIYRIRAKQGKKRYNKSSSGFDLLPKRMFYL
jgi:hypothetical protein